MYHRCGDINNVIFRSGTNLVSLVATHLVLAVLVLVGATIFKKV